ncbi:hypothetical protein WBJ53_05520 [Spirosoma sp. SC4-14]|uniref:hypothetical protein n=1 Tax=Spirosoma sp. SC4-14 TaxID=3128900 RepID=UPI0030CB7A49
MLPSGSISWRHQFDQHRGRVGLVYKYVTGQGLLQLLNVLNGFFLLRWLSIDEQAKFSLAMGLQATLGILGDLGLGGSLLGLIGDRVDDRKLIGQYVAGIQRFKDRFFIVSAFIGSIAVAIFYQKQNWGSDLWIIYGLVLLGIYAQSMIGYYSAILQMKKDLLSYYRTQVTAAFIRLIAAFLLYYSLELNAIQAVFIATIAFMVNAIWVRQYALAYFEPVRKANPDKIREIFKTVWPVMPMVAFYAIQGQMTIFLSGYFGKATNVAEIGALGRLSQIFSLFTPFTSIVLLPYFARSNTEEVLKRAILIVIVSTSLVFPLVVIAYYKEDFFIWMLGSKFFSVKDEILLFICVAAINYVAGILWAIIIARKFNRGYLALINIFVLLTVQLIYIRNADLSTTHSVVVLSVYLSTVSLLSNIFILMVGIRGNNTSLYF